MHKFDNTQRDGLSLSLSLSLSQKFPLCLEGTKNAEFSVVTQFYCLINQVRAQLQLCSHHQVDPKNFKRKYRPSIGKPEFLYLNSSIFLCDQIYH